MKVEIKVSDDDPEEYIIEYDEEAKVKLLGEGADFLLLKGLYELNTDEVVLACEQYAIDRYNRYEGLKAREVIATMTEYWENPS